MKRPLEDAEDLECSKKIAFASQSPNEESHTSINICCSGSTSEEYANQTLLPWFSDCGFLGLDQLEFRYSNSCCNTLGCFSQKPFAVGDLLFEIPQSHIFNIGKVLTSPLSSFVQETTKKHDSGTRFSLEFLYWIHMIAEKEGVVHQTLQETEIRKSSSLQPYFRSLSSIPPSILTWEDELLEAIQSTNLCQSVSELKSSIHQYCQLIEDFHSWNEPEAKKYLPKEIFHYDSLLWAAGHYMSRRYPSHFGSSLSAEKKEEVPVTVSLKIESLLGNVGSLVPLLDILNHNHDQEWLKFNIKDGKLQVICNYPIAKVSKTYPLLLFSYSVSVSLL
jgi:hypothetical protein